MKWLTIIMACTGVLSLGFLSRKRSMQSVQHYGKEVQGKYSPVAVLELFTSEGCSSCPPADRLLPELVKTDTGVIALSFHVDYWDRLGWKDPYSKAEFSERQYNYVEQMNLQSAYTPQLVVNGEYELVGSNHSQALAAIQKALKEKAAVALTVSDVTLKDKQLSFIVSANGKTENMKLQAALVQQQASTAVKAGENRGAKLSHINIVRSLITKDASASTSFEFTMPANLATGNWRLVVYTQQEKDLKITGAAVYTPR
jgi:hypothetical protein